MDPHDPPINQHPALASEQQFRPAITPSAFAEGTSAPIAGPQSVHNHEDVLALISDVERQLERMRGVQVRSAEEFAQYTERAQRLDAREHEIHVAEALLTGRHAQLEAMSDALREERVQLCHRAEELERQTQDHSEGMMQLESLRAETIAQRDRNAIESRRLEDGNRELATARDELSARHANDGAEVASLRLELDQLRECCDDAESSLASRDTVVEAKDIELAERSQKYAEMERELEMTRQSLRTAGEKLAALAKSMADLSPQLERGAAALAMVSQLQRTVETQREELESLRTRAGTESSEAVETERRKVTDAEAEVARLTQRIAAIATAQDADRSTAAADVEARTKQLEQTSARLDEALAFLRTRKLRLDKAQRFFRERKIKRESTMRESAESALVHVLEQERLVKRQRDELRSVQEILTVSEQTMLLRYARHRGGLVAAWMVIVTSALAAASWFASDLVLPKMAVASVDLVAKTKDGALISPEGDAAWQSLQRSTLADETFRSAVRRRLQERGVAALRNESDINEWIDNVRIDSDGPGAMRLVAETSGPDTAILALDTLATTLVNEVPKFAKGKGEIAKTALAGQTAIPGRVTFSTLVPQEGRYDRLVAAGLIFSGVFTVGLFAGAAAFGRIARSKRKFEDAERFGATL